VQTSSASTESDLLQMVAAYLSKVGVKMEIQTMEYGAYFSAMMTKTNAPGYFMFLGNTNPTTALRKSFVKGRRLEPHRSSATPSSTRRWPRPTPRPTSVCAR
jgi:peptide/nickel transport system substrate-binding protein